MQIRGDLTNLNKALVANLHPTRLGGMGKKAGRAVGIGLGAGLAVGAAGAGLFKLGKSFDEQFDKIRVGTGKTGISLKGLEGDFKDVAKSVPDSFEDSGTAITQLQRRLGLTGKPLRDLSTQFLQLSRITGTDLSANIESVARAFEDWEVKDQSEALDGLFRLGQKSGASVEQLAASVQKFGSPLRILGFSLGEAAATFATFERAGVNTQTMVPGLKLAIANLTKPTADLGKRMAQLGIDAGKPEEGLRKVFALLGNESTLTDVEKTTLAMEVFGKRAGADMAEAIRQGRFEVDAMFKTFGKGDTIAKATRDTEDFTEQWNILKNRVFIGLEPIATNVFKAIGDGMTFIGDHLDTFKALAKVVGGLTAAFISYRIAVGGANAVTRTYAVLAGTAAASTTAATASTAAAGGSAAAAGAAAGGAAGGFRTLAARVAAFTGVAYAGYEAGKLLGTELSEQGGGSKLKGFINVVEDLGTAIKENLEDPLGNRSDLLGPIKNLFDGPSPKDAAAPFLKAQQFHTRGGAEAEKALLEARNAARATLPAIVAAEQNLAAIRKAGKSGTHAEAEAIRALDAAEGERLAALHASAAAQRSAESAAKRAVGGAFLAYEAAKKQGAGARELAKLIGNVAKANSNWYATQLNVKRALGGLTPVTGAAKRDLGDLLRSLKGISGLGAFKKFVVTADISSVNAAVRLIGQLKDLGRSKTALRIIAESKTPEEALKRLHKLVGDLRDRQHRITMRLKDEATLRLEKLKRFIDRMPEKKTLTFEASAKLTRDTRRLLNFAGQGQAAKSLLFGGRAKGGTVKRNEALTLVGEEGPELAKFPGGKQTILGQAGPEIRHLPTHTRVFSHTETKRKLKSVVEKVSRVLPGVAQALGVHGSPAIHRLPVHDDAKLPSSGEGRVANGMRRGVGPEVGHHLARGLVLPDQLTPGQPQAKAARHTHPPLADTKFVPHGASLSMPSLATGGDKQRDGRSLPARALDHVLGAARSVALEGQHSLGAKVKHLLVPQDARASSVKVPAGGYRLDRDAVAYRPDVRDGISPTRPTFDQAKIAPLGLSLQSFFDGGRVLPVPAAGDKDRTHADKVQPKLEAADSTLQVIRVPGGQHVAVQQEGNLPPKVIRVADSLRTLVDKPAKARVTELSTVRDRTVRSLVTNAVRRSDTKRESTSHRTSSRQSSVLQRMAKQLGIQAFARGGLVRPDEEERDPTARGKGQPDRGARGSGGKVPYEDKRTLRGATASVSSGIPTRANKLDRLKLPYVWGGGHGNIAQALKTGFDCSGAVSYVLGIPARVSGQFSGWGKPGPGEVATYSNAKHVVMSIGNRMFGTGDDTGPHWLSGGPGPRFSAPFATRHIGKAGERSGFAAPGKDEGKDDRPHRFNRLSLGQYVTVAKRVGFPDPALAAAIFYAESKGDVDAVNKTDREWSLGAAQVNVRAHKRLNTKSLRERLRQDIFFNFREAKKISGGGKNFKPWTQFTTGAYKPFLGGRATPLPKGKDSGTPAGSSFADYLTMKLDDAAETPGQKDDLRWINRGLKYWRGIMRRNRGAGNWSRVNEARGQVKDLRERKVALRDVVDEDAFTLDEVSSLNAGTVKWNIAGLQPQLDRLDLDIGKAALTENLDAAGDVTPDSYGDDIAAATGLRDFWQNVYDLTIGKLDLGMQVKAVQGDPSKVKRLADGRFSTKVGNRTYTFSATPGDTITVGGKKVTVPGGPELEKRPGIVLGTGKQQLEAATSLKSARDALRSVQDEMKSEAVSSADAEAKPDFAEELKKFLAAFARIGPEFGPNFKSLPSFAKGGTSRLPIALVGEEGYELAKPPGRKPILVGQEGPEVRQLPVNTRVFSHSETQRKLAPLLQKVTQKVSRVFMGTEPELAQTGAQPRLDATLSTLSFAKGGLVPGAERTKRMAKQMGIQAFQSGGVVAPLGQPAQAPTRDDESLLRALARLEAAMKREPERQLVEQHLHFVSPPEEQYGVQKNALAELQNSL